MKEVVWAVNKGASAEVGQWPAVGQMKWLGANEIVRCGIQTAAVSANSDSFDRVTRSFCPNFKDFFLFPTLVLANQVRMAKDGGGW